MKNQITACVEFYFKGNKYSASIELDLDQHMQATGKVPDLYPMLARGINLDLYSYEYEIMLSETIFYKNASGLVENFIIDNVLDNNGFEQAWKERNVIKTLQTIAKQYLNIDDLHQHTEVKNALLAAYYHGSRTHAE